MVNEGETTTPSAQTDLLAHADEVCRQQGVTFTPIRRDVFMLLCRHSRPVGAYELLDELKALRPNAAPVTVYRALDFLVGAGLAHKVNTLNAFTACRGSDLSHRGLMLICRKCSQVIELEDPGVERSIERTAAGLEFETSELLVEVVGTCAACRR